MDLGEPLLCEDTDHRWGLVMARDRSADGRFVYAVRSTRVYCRPSCPSRRPGRHNVELFDDSAGAEAAGFRACLRCLPSQARELGPASAVVEACRLLDGATDEPTLAQLARQVGVGPSRLRRLFKSALGVTPRQYAAGRRLERVRDRLQSGPSVTAALFDAGYGSSRAFYEKATMNLGMKPSEYRRGGVAQEIAYTIVDSRLGRLLVAATSIGVCAVRFGEDGVVVRGLADEFPRADIRRDDGALAQVAGRVVAAVDGNRSGQEDEQVPLDVRATAFQMQVWTALRSIAHGETRSYAEVARAVGRPTAVRAVAGACAANPVAVVVPCHRVVGADGAMRGYRWGVERKQALLEVERAESIRLATEESMQSRPVEGSGS